MSRILLWSFPLLLPLVVACSSPSPEELAMLAAKGYYDHLVRGEYEQFLEGKAGADQLPDDYRAQLVAGLKQFMAQQNQAHHGILDVRAATARTDTGLHYTNVFLVLCFADSTNEEVVVPMVEQGGRWRMR